MLEDGCSAESRIEWRIVVKSCGIKPWMKRRKVYIYVYCVGMKEDKWFHIFRNIQTKNSTNLTHFYSNFHKYVGNISFNVILLFLFSKHFPNNLQYNRNVLHFERPRWISECLPNCWTATVKFLSKTKIDLEFLHNTRNSNLRMSKDIKLCLLS